MSLALVENNRYIRIKNKLIDTASIATGGRSGYYVHKKYNTETELAGSLLLKKMLANGEYLGTANFLKAERMGHLFKIDSDYYAGLNINLKSVFFVTAIESDFEIITPYENTMITVNNKDIDVSEIEITDYFKDRLTERFDIAHEAAEHFFTEFMLNAKYICVTRSNSEKSPAHLFCYDKKLVYISLDFSRTVTTYPAAINDISPFMTGKISDYLFSEIQRMTKLEERIGYDNKKLELEGNIRIAFIDMEIFNSTDPVKVEELKQEKEDIQQRNIELVQEWEKLVDDIRQHAIALAAFI